MSKFIATDVSVVINGVTLSDHAFATDTPEEYDQVDVSGFSSTNAKETLPGQKSQAVEVQFLQDFATASVHQTLQPIFTNKTTVLLTLKPTSGAVSAANPKLEGSVGLYTYNGLAAQLNQRAEITALFQAVGSTGLVWGTA